MTVDPQPRSATRLVLYGLAFRMLRVAWRLGESAALPASRAQRQSASELTSSAPCRLELEAGQGSPPRPEGA